MSELEFHLQAMNLLRLGIRPEDGFAFHVPNQGKRSLVTGGLFKGMGMLPGMTDLILVARDGRVAFLELKRPDGKGKLRPDQEAFRDRCASLGIKWGSARTLDEVADFARAFYGLSFRVRT